MKESQNQKLEQNETVKIKDLIFASTGSNRRRGFQQVKLKIDCQN